jgi:hypothetical protein
MEKIKKDPVWFGLVPPDFDFNTLRFRQIGQPRHRHLQSDAGKSAHITGL